MPGSSDTNALTLPGRAETSVYYGQMRALHFIDSPTIEWTVACAYMRSTFYDAALGTYSTGEFALAC